MAEDWIEKPSKVTWYVNHKNHDLGYFSYNEVIRMIEEKKLNADTKLWVSGMAGWTPLHRVPAFSGYFPKRALSKNEKRKDDRKRRDDAFDEHRRQESRDHATGPRDIPAPGRPAQQGTFQKASGCSKVSVMFWLIFFAPVGLILLWQLPNDGTFLSNRQTKISITIFFVLMYIIFLSMSEELLSM